MKKKYIVSLGLVVLATSATICCLSLGQPLNLLAPLEFKTKQRSTKSIPLPNYTDRFTVTLGDITDDQVQLSLTDNITNVVLVTRSVKEGDVITFKANSDTYFLKLTDLDNNLIRDDVASFKIWQEGAVTDDTALANKQIATLIESMSKLEDAKFIGTVQNFSHIYFG